MYNMNKNDDLELAHLQSGFPSSWFLVELEFGNAGFWREGKTGVPREKPLVAKERFNNKLHPHMASTSGRKNVLRIPYRRLKAILEAAVTGC